MNICNISEQDKIKLDENINKISNIISCKLFDKVYDYNDCDITDEINKVKNIFKIVKNTSLNEEYFNYIIDMFMDTLFELKSHIIRIEYERTYYKDLIKTFSRDVKTLTTKIKQKENIINENEETKKNQIKEWIIKNVELDKKNKEIQSKLSLIEEEYNKDKEIIKKLNNNNNKLNNQINKLNNQFNKLNDDYIKLNKDYDELNNKYKHSIELNNKENDNYTKLIKDFEEINNRYKQNSIELNNKLNDEIKINKNYNDLSNEYNKLNDKYNKLLKNVNMYNYYMQYNYYLHSMYMDWIHYTN